LKYLNPHFSIQRMNWIESNSKGMYGTSVGSDYSNIPRSM
jgi:hypothetical protein